MSNTVTPSRIARVREIWERIKTAANGPSYDIIGDTYVQNCKCFNYPNCRHVTDEQRGAILRDYSEDRRWAHTFAELDELARRWSKLEHVGSYGRAATELETRLAPMRAAWLERVYPADGGGES